MDNEPKSGRRGENDGASRCRLARLTIAGVVFAALGGLCAATPRAVTTSVASSRPSTMPAATQAFGVADPETYLAAFCKAANTAWPKNRTLTLIFHGDSVPAGYAKTPEVRPFDAYPHLLWVALNKRFPHAVLNVITTAIGGEASDAGAARFERDVLPLRPDVVFVDYALNDPRIGVDRARVAWQSMIDRCKRAGIPVILMTPTADLAAKPADSGDPLNRLADMIRALAAENHVGLVDSLAAFKTATASGIPLESLMAQRNHPNRHGHELVVPRLLEWFPATN